MTIKEFEKEQTKLLRNREVREAWLEYQSSFPHVSLYYRRAPQYTNQIARIKTPDGKEKKAGTDVNLYKLFLEQCFNLLRDDGRCGILLPTGIYTDLGAKQLREMLFTRARIDSLFGLSNEKFLFEGVDHRFRICLLNFQKGSSTTVFAAAFRMDPREAVSVARLESFLHNPGEHVRMAEATIRLLSPTSLSILELKSSLETKIACRMASFPTLADKLQNCWNFRLVREFDVSKKNQWLLHSSPAGNRLPLFKGDMFNQFELSGEVPDYWIDEVVGQARLNNQQFASYRWVHRRIARSSDVRTMISTIVPPRVFTDTNSTTLDSDLLSKGEMLFLCAVTNSFVFDWLIRKRVDDTLSQFFLYQMPVPRLSGDDPRLAPFITRASRLICYLPEFSDLWQDVMGTPWSEQEAATELAERAQLRAELDGLVAHLYGLTEDEFSYILTTFPVVAQEVKDAALEAYRALAPRPGDPEILSLVEQGESAELEFKSTARWDLRQGKKSPDIEAVIRHTAAGFLNAHGGTLLIGVADDGSIVGLELDYGTFKKPNRDGFELFLTELLLGSLGKDLATSIRITFHEVDGKDVCRVKVAAGPRPVFLKEGNDEVFFLRAGNSTRRLSTREAVQYCKTHWTS